MWYSSFWSERPKNHRFIILRCPSRSHLITRDLEARDNHRARLSARHLLLALRHDEDLNLLTAGITLSQVPFPYSVSMVKYVLMPEFCSPSTPSYSLGRRLLQSKLILPPQLNMAFRPRLNSIAILATSSILHIVSVNSCKFSCRVTSTHQ